MYEKYAFFASPEMHVGRRPSWSADARASALHEGANEGADGSRRIIFDVGNISEHEKAAGAKSEGLTIGPCVVIMAWPPKLKFQLIVVMAWPPRLESLDFSRKIRCLFYNPD